MISLPDFLPSSLIMNHDILKTWRRAHAQSIRNDYYLIGTGSGCIILINEVVVWNAIMAFPYKTTCETTDINQSDWAARQMWPSTFLPKNWSQLAHHQANLARETIHAKEDEIAGGSGALLHHLLHHARLLLPDLRLGAAGDRPSGGRTNQQGLTRAGKTGTCQIKVRISWSTKRIYPTSLRSKPCVWSP